MSEHYASIGGHRLTRVKITVGNVGPWFAECDFDGAPEVSGRVTLQAGGLELSGTVAPDASGVYEAQRKCRIVAGGGGWASALEPKHYHNDAGVKARTIAEDAARSAGERLGSFVPTRERVGADYVRQAGTAARVLEDVSGGAPWWVDYDGVTHVGPRARSQVDAYEVLAYDPRERVITLATDNPGAVQIGSVLTKTLEGPATVRGLEITVDGVELRVALWRGLAGRRLERTVCRP